MNGNLKSQSGVSLLEIMMIVVFSAVVFTSVVVAYNKKLNAEEVRQQRILLEELFKGVNEVSAFQKDYRLFKTPNTLASIQGYMVLPDRLASALLPGQGGFSNVWGGDIKGRVSNSSLLGVDDLYTITLSGVPKDACINMMQDVGYYYGITINEAPVMFEAPDRTRPDIGSVIASCNKDVNTVAFIQLKDNALGLFKLSGGGAIQAPPNPVAGGFVASENARIKAALLARTTLQNSL